MPLTGQACATFTFCHCLWTHELWCHWLFQAGPSLSPSHLVNRRTIQRLRTRSRSPTWRSTVRRCGIFCVQKGKLTAVRPSIFMSIQSLIYMRVCVCVCVCVCSGKQTLKVREHKILGPYVENLSKLAVRSFKVSSLQRTQQLQLGPVAYALSTSVP